MGILTQLLEKLFQEYGDKKSDAEVYIEASRIERKHQIMKMAKKKEYMITNPWQNLADAIVIQAAKDYRQMLKRLNRKSNNETAKTAIRRIEQFFRSEWHETLTGVPAELLIRKLREEVVQ